MNFLDSISSGIAGFLDGIYSRLTDFFQSINLDESLAIFCEYNVLVCAIIFFLILPYFIFFDKKRTIYNFRDPMSLIAMLCLFIVYYLLMDRPLNLQDFGLGTVNLTPFLLTIVAYLYGAIPSALFGAAEYLLACVTSQDDPMMFGLFFTYAMGGLIHGFFLYEHKISFWRCLVSRAITVIVCNIILLAFVRAGTYTHAEPLSVFIPVSITANILQIPIQALAGYIALRFIKIGRERFEL